MIVVVDDEVVAGAVVVIFVGIIVDVVDDGDAMIVGCRRCWCRCHCHCRGRC